MYNRDMICKTPDCGQKVHSRGWCRKHYTRWYRHGDPTKTDRHSPRKPSEIKEMTDIEAAQVGRMIDTDGCISRNSSPGPLNWSISFWAKTIPALANDLLQLTGAGHVQRDKHGPASWRLSAFWSVHDLVHRIAPWSHKARTHLPNMEKAAKPHLIHRTRPQIAV